MRILAILYFLITANSFAQDEKILLSSFVKKDTVLLRWAPASADLLIAGLKNGYTVERIENSRTFEENTSLKSFQILPFADRKATLLNSNEEEFQSMVLMVESLINDTQLTAPAKQLGYFMLVLGAGSNKAIADLLGIYFADIQVSEQAYSYRIILNKSDHKSDAIYVQTESLSENENITDFIGSARPKLKQAYLSWEAKSLEKNYSAYWIERSTDSIHFSKRNNTPYYFFISKDEPNKSRCDFVDTNVLEGIKYYYRIVGINHFAEMGLSSKIVSVYIPKSVYGEVHIDSVLANGFERNLSGEFFPHREKNEIKKFVLLRSDSLNFGYEVIAEEAFVSNTFQFTSATSIESGDRYYYKVVAVGADNDSVFSFPYYFFTLDQIPPAIPLGLKGEINDSGIVTLQWLKNSETDIRGYRVYRSNSLKEEFVEVTKIFCEAGHFYDTLSLNNLTNNVYYRISAVDLNYNNSKLCAPVKLLKPDTIAPMPIVFTDYNVDSSGVLIKWSNSTSKDISHSILLRKIDLQIDTLLRWSNQTNLFLDTNGISGNSYEYFAITLDHSKNKAISEFLEVNYETGIRVGVSDITIATDLEKKQILITWKLPTEEIYSIQIYRAKNDGNFILYKTLRTISATEFSDTALQINNEYHYKIKVVYKSGISSKLSKTLSAVY